MGQIFSDYVHACMNFWQQQQNYQSFAKVTNQPPYNPSNPGPGFEVAVFNGPVNGNTNGEFNGENEQSEGLVVLGFNPSGAKLGTSASKLISGTPGTSSAIYEYDPFVNGQKGLDPFTKAVQQFAINCGYSNNYYKLDAFGIIQKTQGVLEKDINNNPSLYDPVFELPISAIVQLKPKVVVFANAGLRRLIIEKLFFNKFINCKWNTNKCAYDITLTDCNRNTHTCYGIFTTMLSGRHPIDKGSRGIIVQVIKNL